MICPHRDNPLVAIVDACLLLKKTFSVFPRFRHLCTPAGHIVRETMQFLFLFLVLSLIHQYQTNHNPLQDLALHAFSRWLEDAMQNFFFNMHEEGDLLQLLPTCFLRHICLTYVLISLSPLLLTYRSRL